MSVDEKNELLSVRFNVFDDSEFKLIASALALLDKETCHSLAGSGLISNLIEQMALSKH